LIRFGWFPLVATLVFASACRDPCSDPENNCTSNGWTATCNDGFAWASGDPSDIRCVGCPEGTVLDTNECVCPSGGIFYPGDATADCSPSFPLPEPTPPSVDACCWCLQDASSARNAYCEYRFEDQCVSQLEQIGAFQDASAGCAVSSCGCAATWCPQECGAYVFAGTDGGSGEGAPPTDAGQLDSGRLDSGRLDSGLTP